MNIAIVTGGGSGIGRVVALKLQATGYHVGLLGRRMEMLEETVAQAQSDGGNMLPLVADVADEKAVIAAFDKVRARYGRLDVLFNNAGTFAVGTPFDEILLEQWQSVVDVNLTGMFLCAREAFRIMRSQSPSGGRIINNGSISAHVPRPQSAPYTATKHAMTGLTRSLSLDGRAYDIACSQIDIGNAATDFTAAMADGVMQANGERAVEPRMDVDHVGDAVLYIAGLPLTANVQFMTVMATKMPYIGRG